MKPLKLEPFSFVAGLVLIFAISPISTSLGQVFTPENPNLAWWDLVALSGGLLLLLSLGLGTALAKRAKS